MLHCLTFLPVSVLSPHLVIDLASNQHKDKMVENCLLAYIDFYIYEMKKEEQFGKGEITLSNTLYQFHYLVNYEYAQLI